MSQKSVEQLLGRLMTDPGFRERAERCLEVACAEEGYDLTEAERHFVGSMDIGRLAMSMDNLIDDRIKRYDGRI